MGQNLTILQQNQYFCSQNMESMVDFVLERGNHKSGDVQKNRQKDPNSGLYNRRKILNHLFQDNETSNDTLDKKRSISDLKYQQISGQLNYFAGKLHGELSKKHIQLDQVLTQLEHQWMRKKIPDFYSYYFLKFAYANTYTRMHELFQSEIQHMSREKDSYVVIKKTIQAREICLANLKRQLASLTELEIQQSLDILRKQIAIRKKKQKENQGKKKKNKGNDEEVGKSWKNKLEIVFQIISHCKKLTSFVVELIKNWKTSIYGISEDPRRFRERVIFFYNEANYLIKMVHDTKFISDSILKKYLNFAKHYDPFMFKPYMFIQNMESITDNEEVFMELMKPTEAEMEKMTKSLMILAEQDYDQKEQSKMLDQAKNVGQLEQRKKFFEKRRDILLDKNDKAKEIQKQKQKQKQEKGKSVKFIEQKKPKSSVKGQKKGQQGKQQKDKQQRQNNISRVQSSLNKVRKIRSVDLKKISPYLSRNDKIAKAQKVIQLQHKFKVAQDEYVDTIKKKNDDPLIKRQEMKKEWNSSQQQIVNNKIFNRYIQQNMRLMEEANKKAYIYKNKVSPQKIQTTRQHMDYNRIGFKDRKQAEYERNLEQFHRENRTPSRDQRLNQYRSHKNFNTMDKKAVIQISNKGVSNSLLAQHNIGSGYQQSGRKGRSSKKMGDKGKKQEQMKEIESKLRGVQKEEQKNEFQNIQLDKSRITNLFESEQRPEVVVMRQQPQKIQEIKQFLYNKIKEQLLEQMKKSTIEKKDELHNLIEEQKIKKLNQIMQQRKKQQEERKLQLERLKISQLQKQRKKIDFQIRVEPIQYAEENVSQYFQKIFELQPLTYHRIFLNEKLQQKKEYLLDQFYLMFLKGYLDGEEVAYSIIRYDWQCESSRKLIIEYVAVKHFYHFMSSIHHILEYLWQHDPVQHIELIALNNAENEAGRKLIEDIQEYASQKGQIFEKNLYSNVTEIKFIWARPQMYKHLEFPYDNFYFGKKFNLKCELMTTAMSMNERSSPIIDMNLEVFTNYVFLLQELFRKYLTPEQVVELRENSTNIRRLKDIFRVIVELQKNSPIVDELTIVEGLNLDDLYEKMKEKTKPPYDRYYWHHFYDRTLANRILLSILEFKLEIQFPINSCHLDDRRFLRINPRRKVLMLRSSVYSHQNIFILNTNNPKIRMFMINAEMYKTMRMELFVFLNLVFNNIVEDTQRYVNSFWLPQLVVNTESGKQVKRITDFSITMKKSFFLSEQIYFSNHQYIKNAISMLPKKSDVIYRDSVIVGFLHTAVEAGSTGMPLYAKMIEKTAKY